MINQITAPDKGVIYLKGRKMQAEDVYNIGYLPEERGLYKKMKVGEQAVYFAQLKGLSRSDAVQELKRWFKKLEIHSWWDRKVEELSKGMAQKVQFIITILHKPELLIFDEPFSGFDPINVNLLTNEILELKRSGSTIIFSTHNMASVEALCDSIALINKSRKAVEGQVDEVRRTYGDNIYELGFRGDTEKLKQVLSGSYELVSETSDGTLNTVKVKLPKAESPNKLLSLVVPQVELFHFNELIPSMNDIFIKLVGEDTSATSAQQR